MTELNRIKALRLARDMTAETLAELVGMSANHVFRLENGQRNLSTKHLDIFAEALGVTAWELIQTAENSGERKFLETFHTADPRTQKAIRIY
jgi:transcriptional regulator with XRE-family HTH domain